MSGVRMWLGYTYKLQERWHSSMGRGEEMRPCCGSVGTVNIMYEKKITLIRDQNNFVAERTLNV